MYTITGAAVRLSLSWRRRSYRTFLRNRIRRLVHCRTSRTFRPKAPLSRPNKQSQLPRSNEPSSHRTDRQMNSPPIQSISLQRVEVPLRSALAFTPPIHTQSTDPHVFLACSIFPRPTTTTTTTHSQHCRRVFGSGLTSAPGMHRWNSEIRTLVRSRAVS